MELARLRVVPIVNENDVVAIEELTGEVFGDNDRLSALVANLVDADLLIIVGSVGGLFTADPNIDADARLIPLVERVSEEEVKALGGPSLDAPWGAGECGRSCKRLRWRLIREWMCSLQMVVHRM